VYDDKQSNYTADVQGVLLFLEGMTSDVEATAWSASQ